MLNSKELALKIASVLSNKRGEDITILRVDHLTSITDYFVIAHANNTIQVKALAEEVEEKLLEGDGIEARRREGYGPARWIVLDYSSVIVHIFHAAERQYYNIERLWMDGSNQVPFARAHEDEEAHDGDAALQTGESEEDASMAASGDTCGSEQDAE